MSRMDTIDSLTMSETDEVAKMFTKSQRDAARTFLREMGVPIISRNHKMVLKLILSFLNMNGRDIERHISRFKIVSFRGEEIPEREEPLEKPLLDISAIPTPNGA